MISLNNARLDVRQAPRQVESLIDWTLGNLDRLAIGALIALGIVGIMLVLREIGHRILRQDPNNLRWKGVIGRVLSRTTVFFMVAAALDIVCSYAAIPSRLTHLADILFIVAAAFQVAIWTREVVLGVVRGRVGEDPGASTLGNAMSLIRVLVNVAVFAIAGIVVLDNLGVNVTALVAGLGIGGIAIGLAAQGIFSDLFAALSMVFDKPFRRGDIIRYGATAGTPGTTGTVERIGLKTTRLRAVSGEQIIMSNTKLLEQELHNIADARVRRTTIPFSITYQTPADVIDRLGEILTPAVQSIKTCKLIRCSAVRFAPSAIDIELIYDDKSRDADTLARHRSAVITGVMRIFESEGIAFAYPSQTSFTAAPDGTLIMPYADEATAEPAPRTPRKQG